MKKISILSLLVLGLMLANAGLVFAAQYDLKQMTPEVQQALDSRKSRFSELESLKTAGKIGETNQGYVQALSGDSQAASVASQENSDRRVVYQTIAEQNGIADQISIVERVFGQVQKDKAAPGVKVQNEDGSWVTK
ncbi:MAG: DUF1318 domain-containing protein [Candidatus Omnitrophica bacterium]|nr:DUF1318 domain-containing protein [Candidatus Omnitrophota bacterium]